MQLREFLVETWLNPRVDAKYNMGSSGVKSIAIDELFELIGGDINEFLKEVKSLNMHYGHFFGFERLKIAVSKMYKNQNPDLILTTHAGTGANHMVLAEFGTPGTNVVAIVPNYQQHYSIPEALGTEVRYVWLKEENSYQPDINEIRAAVDEKTSIIAFSNPNNPTGAFIEEALLKEICAIAEKVDAIVLSDEIYRGLRETYMPSAVDFYKKGVVTSSMSKVLSMAGTRVGWIATNDKGIHDRLETRRSFDTICGGIFDEWITAIALEHFDKILERNRNIVKENRAVVEKWLANEPHLSGKVFNDSPIAFLKYDFDISATEFGERLYKEPSILVCHGDCFDVPKSFRLGFGYIDKKILAEGLQVFSKFMSTLK